MLGEFLPGLALSHGGGRDGTSDGVGAVGHGDVAGLELLLVCMLQTCWSGKHTVAML